MARRIRPGKSMIPFRNLLFACLAALLQHAGRTAEPPVSLTSTQLVLIPARVFDGEGGKVHEGWAVLVSSNRIRAVGPVDDLNAPSGARRIVLPDVTLLPGLSDIHSHIFLHPYNETLWDDQVLKEPVAYRSIRATLHARDTLLAGFTLLRDLGTEGAGF